MPLQDGLGDRRQAKDQIGAALELLSIRHELAVVPSFEFALRERISRLATFKHPSFARVRGLERSGAGEPLTLVSEEVAGVRLSDFLSGLASRQLPVDIGAALGIVRQVIPAVATLHETVRDVAHGALTLDRIVLAPNARPVITEHVLGSALEQLLFSRERYWSELGIALPRMAGLPRFDQLTDVTELGAIALALILGRRLAADEYPARVAEIVAHAHATNADGTREPLKPALKAWLERALQLDPRASYPSAVEARAGLEKAIAESGYDASVDRVEWLLGRYHGLDRPAPASVTSRPPTGAMPIPVTNRPPTGRMPIPQAVAPETAVPQAAWPQVIVPPAHPILAVGTPVPTPAPAPRVVEPVRLVAPAAVNIDPEGDASAGHDEAAEPVAVTRKGRWRLMAATVAIVIVVSGGATMGAMKYLAAPEITEPPAVTGTLVVTSTPTGAQASIDGTLRGTTPLTLTLPAGRHIMRLTSPLADARSVPLTIPAGGQLAQHIELGQDAVALPATTTDLPMAPFATDPATDGALAESGPSAGWITVNSRFEVRLFEQGQLLGSSQSARIMVPVGKHDLEVVSDEIGYKGARSIQVVAGKVAAINVEVPSGTVALNALPWAEVSIDGKAIGETPIGNVSVPVGSHEVVFRHPELGEKRQTILVTLKAPARITADLRQP